jgi:CheY-like chemotaxis protein
MSDKVRVLIADEMALVRESLKRVLELTDGLEVVGTATHSSEAVELARKSSPDVVLMDIDIPGANEVEAINKIKREGLAHSVVILSIYGDSRARWKVRLLGTATFVEKNTPIPELVEIIRESGTAVTDESAPAEVPFCPRCALGDVHILMDEAGYVKGHRVVECPECGYVMHEDPETDYLSPPKPAIADYLRPGMEE